MVRMVGAFAGAAADSRASAWCRPARSADTGPACAALVGHRYEVNGLPSTVMSTRCAASFTCDLHASLPGAAVMCSSEASSIMQPAASTPKRDKQLPDLRIRPCLQPSPAASSRRRSPSARSGSPPHSCTAQSSGYSPPRCSRSASCASARTPSSCACWPMVCGSLCRHSQPSHRPLVVHQRERLQQVRLHLHLGGELRRQPAGRRHRLLIHVDHAAVRVVKLLHAARRVREPRRVLHLEALGQIVQRAVVEDRRHRVPVRAPVLPEVDAAIGDHRRADAAAR